MGGAKMSGEWLLPDRVFDGGSLRAGVALHLEVDRVTSVRAEDVPPGTTPRPIEGTVSPGFIDLQVNGGGGVMLNSQPTLAGMDAIAAAHAGLGTVAILPTVITDAPEVLEAAANAAIAAKAQGRPRLLGLHIEGPHIDPVRRGTHAARFIRPLDDAYDGGDPAPAGRRRSGQDHARPGIRHPRPDQRPCGAWRPRVPRPQRLHRRKRPSRRWLPEPPAPRTSSTPCLR
jgi:hypothetical protein